MSELEDFTRHISDRISSLQRMLELAVIVPQDNIRKFGQEVRALEGLLHEFEKCVDRQNDQLKRLKEFERSFQNDLGDVQHLKDNMPAHLPRRKLPAVANEPAWSQKGPAEMQLVQQEKFKKSSKSAVRQMEVVTMPEFDSIPLYMKGRVTYEQLNSAVQNINTAVTGKYKILHQSAKNLNNHSRKLYQRFKDEETKDTKGQFFVVETDIREFTQTKVDKRFQGILNMLRHCQRLRELRGGGLTRYVLL